MDLPKNCDVLIIGGGPTGSAAATFLQQKGYSPVILEKKKHPRYMVGESLIPHVWKYVEAMGATDAIVNEGFVTKSGGTVVWDGVIRQMAFKSFGYDRPAMHVERDRFDYLLLEHTKRLGVPVLEEATVQHVDLDRAGGPVVTYRAPGETTPTEIQARYVFDASGQSGVLAKQLGLRVIDQAFKFMSLWGYFQDSKYFGIDGRAHQFSELRTTAPTTFVSSLPGWGWLWHIALRTTTSVGLVVPVEHLKQAKSQEDLSAFFLRRCSEIPYLNRLLEGAKYEGELHAIRDYSYAPTRAAGPGFFLLGDAAGFIDPIFSVGVPLGMYAAYLATWAVDRSFTDPSRAERSRASYEKQLFARLEMSRALALPCYQPPGEASKSVKTTIQFEASLEQELIHVVTSMTTRGANFDAIQEGEKLTSNKYWELADLSFDPAPARSASAPPSDESQAASAA
jgi:flavin-dependent dehydrogenase